MDEAIIQRVATGKYSLYDPCVICGVPFQDCRHTVQDTEPLISKALGILKFRRSQKRGRN